MSAIGEHEMSTLALDVYWASGRGADAGIETHLAECARCRDYLAHLDAVAAAQPSPKLAPAREVLARVRTRRSRGRRLWIVPAAAALAVAASVLLMVRARGTADGDRGYVGAKGAVPAVQLLVHRGTATSIWDGHAPVRPGDALALRVACEGMRRVTIAVPDAAGWARLSDAACPGDTRAPLPFTLVVDDQPGDERFAVVLSRRSLDAEGLRRAIRRATRASDVWVVSFELPKTTGGDR